MKSTDEIQIWSARLADFPLDETTLSPDERERAARFKFERDRHHFIARRRLLRKILGDHLNVSPEKLVFNYEAKGKPKLPGLHFNASHSNGMVLIAISPQVPIGVDIEFIRPMEDMAQITKSFFSPPERAQVKNEKDFFRFWSRKEAFLKATGEGLSDRLTEMDVTGDSYEGVYLHDLSIASEFSAALGITGRAMKFSCQTFI